MPSTDGPHRHRRLLGRRRFLAVCGATVVAGCGAGDEDTTTATTEPHTTTTQATTTGTTTETTTTTRESFPGTWPGYGYDLANTGYNAESGAVGSDARRWSTFVEGYYTLPAPAVSATGVYIGSRHRLFGLLRSDGTTVWDVDMGSQTDLYTHLFTPTVQDGVVYGVARDLAGADSGSDVPGTVAAIDERSGTIEWRVAPYVSGSPTVVDGLVVYPTSTATTGGIEARSVTDGGQVWRYAFGDRGSAFGAPAYADGTVYATGSVDTGTRRRGRLAALEHGSGDQRWTVAIDDPVTAAPVVAGQAVIVADDAGTVYSVDRSDRTERWSVSVGESVYARPAVTPDRVFAISRGTLTAIDRSDGAVAWTAPIGSSHFSTVSVAGETVYVGGPTLYAYNVADGSAAWSREIPGYAGAYGGPVVVDGDLFVGACVKQDPGDLYDNFVYRLG